MGTLALIGLGSNLGDRKGILDAAVSELRQTPGVLVRSVSTCHETRPIGGPSDQGPFLNAAAALETTLEPMALLRRLQGIESDAGRVRSIRWGERTLDLDLLLFGDEIIDTPELSVPHPRMGVRRFVLMPLEEIAPEFKDPLSRLSISALRANLDRRPSCLALRGWWEHPEKSSVYQRIDRELDGVSLSLRDMLELGNGFDAFLAVRLEPYELLGKLVSWLDSRRWSGLGEQWLVTDFALRETVVNAFQHWQTTWETELWPFLARLEEHEPSLIQPTLTVYGIRLSPSASGTGYIGEGRTCIDLESEASDEQVSEILAACAATRT